MKDRILPYILSFASFSEGVKNLDKNSAMVRVNTRISKQANDWLDNQSATSGIPKSTLILLAIENYIQQKEVMERMSDMTELMQKLNAIEDKLQ